MLETLTHEQVQEIINLSNACYPNQGEPTVVTVSDIMDDILVEPEGQKLLREYVESLTLEARSELCALMWLGRGASGETIDDWERLVRSGASHDVHYIISKVQLSEYLGRGLSLI